MPANTAKRKWRNGSARPERWKFLAHRSARPGFPRTPTAARAWAIIQTPASSTVGDFRMKRRISAYSAHPSWVPAARAIPRKPLRLSRGVPPTISSKAGKQLRARFAVVAVALAGLSASPRESIEDIARSAQGRVGASAVLLIGERRHELFSFHAREHFPMQSVYKLPIAMAALHEVDRSKLQLDAEVRVEQSEYLRPGQYSPLRDQNPSGATVTVRELLRLAVSESDGTASDVVLRLFGGTSVVMTYLREIGIRDLQVLDTEKGIGEDDSVQYRNWATPESATEVLRALLESRGLAKSSRDL